MRSFNAILTTALAGAMLAAPGIASAADAAPAPCLTSAELTALASYTMSSIVTGLSQRCAASLPPDAFLRTGADALADRYTQIKPAAWPRAKAALLKLSAGSKGGVANTIKNLPDATQQQLVDTLVAGAVVEKMPMDRCLPVSKILHTFAAVPPEEAAVFLGMAVGLGSRKEAGAGFAVCTP